MRSYAQILYERGGVSENTSSILHKNLISALKEPLKSGSQFWHCSKTLKTLSEKEYFATEEDKDNRSGYPAALKQLLADGKCTCTLKL